MTAVEQAVDRFLEDEKFKDFRDFMPLRPEDPKDFLLHRNTLAGQAEFERLAHDAKRKALEYDLERARNRQTTPEFLARLLHHSDVDVVLAAIKNPKTPILDILDVLPSFLKTGENPLCLPSRIRVASGLAEKARLERLARQHLGAGNNVPVRILLNSQKPPTWAGKRYGWESPGGSEWRGGHAPGWPYYKTYLYRGSTSHIKVGSGWPGFTHPYALAL